MQLWLYAKGETLSNLPANIPDSTLSALLSSIADSPEERDVQLFIRVRSSRVNVRELSAYLTFLDRLYGRLTVGSLYRYARRPDEQLKINLRQGSIWIEILSSLNPAAEAIVVIWLAMKYLPLAAEKSGVFFSSMADAYKTYEEGRLTRAQRKELERKDQGLSPATRSNLEQMIRSDQDLQQLPPERVRQLAELIDVLYGNEEGRLGRAISFTDDYVQQFVLRVGKQEFKVPSNPPPEEPETLGDGSGDEEDLTMS